jgi:hypothetical protein
MISKHVAMAGIVGALAIGLAAPSFAQNYDYGNRHTGSHFSYGPQESEAGECFVTTDPVLGYGYWGSCAARGQAVGRSTGAYKTQNYPAGPR